MNKINIFSRVVLAICLIGSSVSAETKGVFGTGIGTTPFSSIFDNTISRPFITRESIPTFNWGLVLGTDTVTGVIKGYYTTGLSDSSYLQMSYGQYSGSDIQSWVGVDYIFQAWKDSAQNMGIKSRVATAYIGGKYDGEATSALALNANVFLGKEMDKLDLFCGAQFPLGYHMVGSGNLQGEILTTYGYIGAEYQINQNFSLYSDYYRDKLWVGGRMEKFLVLIGIGPSFEVRMDNPFASLTF